VVRYVACRSLDVVEVQLETSQFLLVIRVEGDIQEVLGRDEAHSGRRKLGTTHPHTIVLVQPGNLDPIIDTILRILNFLSFEGNEDDFVWRSSNSEFTMVVGRVLFRVARRCEGSDGGLIVEPNVGTVRVGRWCRRCPEHPTETELTFTAR